MSIQTRFTIGKLAEKVGVNVETIRYYQRIGLLNEPSKPAQGFRTYSADDVARLQFIKRAQELGFSLSEIAELLALGDSHCGEVQQLAESKLQSIDERIAGFMKMRTALAELVACCQSERADSKCPLIRSLSSSDEGL